MRIIGTLLNENLARKFCAYLKRQKIETSCEMSFDPANGHMSYPIWVKDEDQIHKAADLLTSFEKNPNDPQFDVPLLSQLEEQEVISQAPPEQVIPLKRSSGRVTTFFVALCSLIFFWNAMQEIPMHEEGLSEKSFLMTPIQGALLYDVPPAIDALEKVVQKYKLTPGQKIEQLPPDVKAAVEAVNEIPYWRGLYDWILLKAKGADTALALGPLFTKIRSGEIWRLFTPCVLHKDFLHILFNMIWVWVLGRPIEQRVGPLRTLLLTLAVGVLSNTAQYLMSGPFFLGYSGVVMGLAGFIWMREKVAPWEGYPLNRSTILFLAFFVLAMFALQLSSFFLLLFTSVQFNPNIANTAHIAGALIGAWLARFKFFAERPLK
jgi:GlpG protein